MPISRKVKKWKRSPKSSVVDCDTGDEVVLDTINDEGANNNASLRREEESISSVNAVLEWGEANGFISKPSANDVILCRGKPFQTHPGNVRLRKIVSEHHGSYLACRREQRRVCAEKVLEGLHESGVRFIKRGVLNRRVFWEPVDRLVALDKVHHLLREKREKKEARDGEREIPSPETENRSSIVVTDNGTQAADLPSLAANPLMGSIREIEFGFPVEPTVQRTERRDIVLFQDHEPFIPLETQVSPLISVSSLTCAGHSIDNLLQGGSSLVGSYWTELHWRRRLLERSATAEQTSIISASLDVPYSYASLQNQHRLEAALSSLLSSSSVVSSARALTTPPSMVATGSSSSTRPLLNAYLSPNPLANSNMTLTGFHAPI